MINATAINAVPVLEDVYAGTTQEWSLRLNVPQHGETHQVLTQSELTERRLFLDSTNGAAWPFSGGRDIGLVSSVCKDCQIDSSLLTQWIMVLGRSSLMESLVWLTPFLCEWRRESEREDERQYQGIKRKSEERSR